MEQNPENYSSAGTVYPPKPVITYKRNTTILRSLLSVSIYILFFYFLFDRNISYIAAILLAVILHDVGHFVAMKKSGYNDPRLFIIPLLSTIIPNGRGSVTQSRLTLIILAGPVPGVVIGCVLLWLNRNWLDPSVTMLANSFLIINLLNCLPFYPLDGGRLVETFFFRESFAIRIAFGLIAIMAMLVLCIILQNFILIFLPVLMALQLFNEFKLQKIRDFLRDENIRFTAEYEELSDKEYWQIRDCLILAFPKQFSTLTAGKYEYSILEPMVIRQIISVLQVHIVADPGKLKLLVSVIFYLVLLTVPVIMILWIK